MRGVAHSLGQSRVWRSKEFGCGKGEVVHGGALCLEIVSMSCKVPCWQQGHFLACPDSWPMNSTRPSSAVAVGMGPQGGPLHAAQQGPLRRMPDAVVAHLVGASGKDVLQESPQELVRRDGHCLPLLLSTILIAESHVLIRHTHKSAIGERHTMDIACQILQHFVAPCTVGLQ